MISKAFATVASCLLPGAFGSGLPIIAILHAGHRERIVLRQFFDLSPDPARKLLPFRRRPLKRELFGQMRDVVTKDPIDHSRVPWAGMGWVL